jgi:hypothetical protein
VPAKRYAEGNTVGSGAVRDFFDDWPIVGHITRSVTAKSNINAATISSNIEASYRLQAETITVFFAELASKGAITINGKTPPGGAIARRCIFYSRLDT